MVREISAGTGDGTGYVGPNTFHVGSPVAAWPAIGNAVVVIEATGGSAQDGGATVAERMIEANGVELCTESFGDPADPPVLLIMGIGGSMLWWEEGFCRMLADGGRFVVRYDHRDTGRSVSYEPGHPGYTGDDLVADAAGVLDAYGIPAAHLVGVSAGGAFAQLLALDIADRVVSLVLISTSPATPGYRGLPPPADEFGRFLAAATVDWSDADSVIEYLVGYARMLAGRQRPFDEAAARGLVRRDVARAHNYAAAQNHDVLPDDERSREPLSSITVPTLVIHGTADPMFPLGHGQALADEIPGARLLTLQGAGHGVDRADWQPIVRAILKHTGCVDRR
jgi:pimeloyl-ACP methyl ester carboxylesterase